MKLSYDGDLDYKSLDILVLDFYSLTDSKGEPNFERIRLAPILWQSFDLKLWVENRLLFFRRKYKDILSLYEIDFFDILYLEQMQLKMFLKFHRSYVLTSRDKILSRLSPYALNCFSYLEIIQRFYEDNN